MNRIDGDIIITRSGTVGVVHMFRAPDDKIYIPSHHLAVLEVAPGANAEYLRAVLRSDFARRYFWAFSSGKGQKEISNWSVKSLPIPRVDDPAAVATEVLSIETDIQHLREALVAKERARDDVLMAAVGKGGPL